MSTTPEDSDATERAARAYDPEAFEDHPIEQRRPLAAIQWGARRRLATEAAQRLAAAGLLAPAGAAWHTDPPPGWSTFGAHAFMDEVPALEFWGEEYGGDGLPIWERPVPAPDAIVAKRIAREIEYARDKCIREQEELRQYGRGALYGLALAADIARSHATPPAASAESVGRFEFDGAEGIAFWVGNSDEETAVKVMFSELESLAQFLRFNFPGLLNGTEAPTEAVSGYTSHGHRITGVVQAGRPTSVARCGGPGLCTVCSREAAATGKEADRG